ncbi:MAG TPA: ComEC/Rec2 family competence protein [Candidatus Avipropionibacterium avicola]|uniref:ComEC/Rec2 family competence protein n=1 Tax=Candidatus Avipropionibacterium avicola TaxID=2840701 RepID=A0A9D1KNR8_9ACTN|nr:ComEC/Rec2 family competence protein [Candidatus Avipropionibacterium avicola]
MLVIVVLGGLALGRSEHLHRSPVAELADQGAVVRAELVVSGDPRISTAGFSPRLVVPVQLRVVEGRGERISLVRAAVASAPLDSALADAVVGSRWQVDGRLGAAEPQDSVVAFLRITRARPIAAPSPSWQVVERLREGLRQSVATRPEGPRALVPALVVGDVSAVSDELKATFVTTGLTHLTAVSGANLTLMLGFVLVMARWIGVRGRWLTVVAVATTAVFVALCRTEPSVLRATAMGLVALAAVGRGAGAGKAVRHLCVAMVALLAIDPWLARSAGFALSTLATGGILVWAGQWADRLRWAPRVVAEAACVPLAAQLATQPVVSALSGQVSVVGLLANALAGPLVGPATVAGFAAAGLSLVHPGLAALAGWAASWPAQGIIWIGQATAALPGAALDIPATPTSLAVLTAACLVTAWWIPHVLSRRWACAVVVLVMVLVLARAPTAPGWPPQHWDVVFCDVGQGDATVVRIGPGTAIVVDTGPDPVPVDRCLTRLGISRVAMLVLTHHHADHIGGLDGIWPGRRVDLVVTGALRSPAWAAEQVEAAVERHGVRLHRTVAGERIVVGGLVWQTVWPPLGAGDGLETTGDDGGGESSAENDLSVVARVVTPTGVTLLLTGDIEPTGQAALLATGQDLRVQVLKVPHHGSGRQDRDFLAATGAVVAVTSSGQGNTYGHPAPRTVELLSQLGMTVLRTDRSGPVAIGLDEDRWSVRTLR